MNTKQKKTLVGLLLAAVVLTGVLIGVKISKNRTAAQEAVAAQAAAKAGILTEAISSYKTLTYFNGNATLSFECNDEGVWFWTNDSEFPLEQSFITAITEALSSLKPQQTIQEGDTLEAYGLDEPSQTLTATDTSGKTTTIKLGKTTTDGNSYYMLMDEAQSPVYIISGDLANKMAPGIYDMMRLPELPTLTEAQLNSIKISGKAETALIASHEQPEAEKNEAGSASASGSDSSEEITITNWSFNEVNVTEDTLTSSVIEQILGLKLDACVDYHPSSQAATLCGFSEPSATITVDYVSETNASGTLTLTVGNRVLDGDGRYVRINDDTTIYRMNADKLDTLMKVSVNGLGIDTQPSPAVK